MKLLLIIALVNIANAANCPSNLLVKSQGAKTFYTSDLSNKFTAKELSKFGCELKATTMTKDQQIALINAEAKSKIEKL